MIRAIIQRIIAPGMESTYDEFAKEVIQAAVAAPGFISGEALYDIAHPNVRYVIVKMRSVEDWQKWARSPEREAAISKLTPVLMEPENITLLSH